MQLKIKVKQLFILILSLFYFETAFADPNHVVLVASPGAKTVPRLEASNKVAPIAKAVKDSKAESPTFELKVNALENKSKKNYLKSGRLEGPGRSGGGNIFNSTKADAGKTLDQVEAESKFLITDFSKQWPGFKAYFAHLNKLKKISSDLPDYLLEAFTNKKWSVVNRAMSFTTCQNGTFLEVNANQKLAGVCQFYDEGLISDQTFKILKSDEQQMTLLIHEGLVNQMLKVLKPLDERFSSEEVDRIQKNIEIKIHQITIKLVEERYNSLEELVADLKEAKLPLIFSEAQKAAMHIPSNTDQIYFASDYYVGAQEKLQIMSDVFNKSSVLSIDKLQQRFGSEVCVTNPSGFSVPGYAVGIYLHLDEIIPEVLFTLQSFRGVFELDLDALAMVRSMAAKMAMASLQIKEGQWLGSYEISVEMMAAELEKADIGPEAKMLMKKQIEFQKTLGSSRVVQLEVRQPTESTVIVKRSVFLKTSDGFTPLFAPDYGMGKLMSCEAKH